MRPPRDFGPAVRLRQAGHCADREGEPVHAVVGREVEAVRAVEFEGGLRVDLGDNLEAAPRGPDAQRFVRTIGDGPPDFGHVRVVEPSAEHDHVPRDGGAGAKEEVAVDDIEIALDPSGDASRAFEQEDGSRHRVSPRQDGVRGPHREAPGFEEGLERRLRLRPGLLGQPHLLPVRCGRQSNRPSRGERDREPEALHFAALTGVRHRSQAMTSSRGSRSGSSASPS